MPRIIDEKEVVYNNNKYNVQTADTVGKLDIIYSYFNHRQLWMEQHKQFWRLRNMSKEIFRLLRWGIQSRFGHRSTEDLSALRGKYSGPAIICGSGPSLNAALPRLKDWKGAVFCATSQAPTLVRYGRHPDFIEAIDPRIEDWEMKAPWNYKKTKFIGCPTLRPAMFDRWAGKKYLYRVYEPNVKFYGDILPMAYIDIHTYSYPFGAVIPLLMAHAHYLGFSPLYLVGADFGYSEEATRFTRYDYLGWGRWKANIPTTLAQEYADVDKNFIDPSQSRQFIKTDNGVMSELLHVHYRNQALRVICFDLSEVFCVPGGIITPEQVPYISLDELMETQGLLPAERHRTEAKILRDTTKALMKLGYYVIEHADGARSMATMANWRKELKVVCDLFNKQGGNVDYGKQNLKFTELQAELNAEQWFKDQAAGVVAAESER